MLLNLTKIKHPYYQYNEENWNKYRLTYGGGRVFTNTYLKTFSKRESPEDFENRKAMSFCPSFAASAINDIKNSIYQRMMEITRIGGHKTYQDAITGKNGGVNLKGASMNNFIGQLLLPELLTMGRVGCFVDMPPVSGSLLSDLQGKQPYLYIYTAEQIPAWNSTTVDGEEILTAVLLKETRDTCDDETNLISGNEDLLRLMTLLPNGEGVKVQFYKQVIDKTTGNEYSELINEIILKGHKRIPFVCAEITHSLLKDIADYQIALLNMESADVAYVLKANFPFYYEFFDPRSQSPYTPTAPTGDVSTENAQVIAAQAKAQEIVVGTMAGRRVPIEGQAPGFIHPSSEPLKASMEKQRQMKNDMRQLVNLALGTLEPKFASAESKGMDDRSLEAGLSYIGLELERVERLVGVSWSAYMKGPDPTIKYPKKYSLKSDKDRREDTKELAELLPKAPSKQYAKEVAKLMAKSLLEQKVSDETLIKIYQEIDDAKYISSDAKDITSDVEAGLVDLITASNARGYEGERVVPLAKKEHEERLTRIAEAQAKASPQADPNDNPAARGNPDASANPKADAKAEKKESQQNHDQDTDPAPSDKTRGENK